MNQSTNPASHVSDVIDLVTRLKLHVAKDTESQLMFLKELVGEDIRIRYEMKRDPEQEKIKSTRQRPFAHLANCQVDRVILTADKSSANFLNTFTRQCNGLILSFPSWKVLSMPSNAFNHRFRLSEICSHIGDYDVYDIKDGTTITLYYYNDSWRMASTNAFDVGHYTWMSAVTYDDAFKAVMKQYPGFSFDKLDKSKSYVIGFRHHEFHPFTFDRPGLWFIQSCDLDELNYNGKYVIKTDEDIGIPLQTLTNLGGHKGNSLHDMLFNKNQQSVVMFTKSLTDGSKTPDIHYGFILRSRTGADDIIIESELLKKIRMLMYNVPTSQKMTNITPRGRMQYMILRSYLSDVNKFIFLQLFPQFMPEYKRYDQEFFQLGEKIISIMRNRSAIPRPQGQKLDALAARMAARLKNDTHINVMDAYGPSIVNDFLMQGKYIDEYCQCFNQ